ncbi:MAG: iron ABC transporter permease [Nitrososphaerota archaeon]|nr:iron ABC transporter permease [Nitrososphaerota archaeon]
MTSKLPIAASAVFAALFVMPLILFFGTSTTLGSMLTAIRNPIYDDAIWTTIYPAAVGTAIALTMGTAYAWIVQRTNVPGKRILSLLPFLGLTQPGEVRAIGLVFLFSPQIGSINRLFMSTFSVSFPLFNIYSNNGLILAHAAGGLPFAYLSMSAAIRGIDPILEDSSRLTGGSIYTSLSKVTLPLLKPALIGTYLAMIPIGMANFDYPFIFGQAATSGVNTLATSIYNSITDTTPPDYNTAGALSIIYVLIALVVVTLFIVTTRQNFKYVTVRGQQVPPTLYSLGKRGKYTAVAVCLAIMTIGFFMEAFILIVVSLVPFYTATQSLIPTLTLENYVELFTRYPLFWSAVQNSIVVSLVAGVATAFLGTLLAYTVVKSKYRWAKIFEYANILPYAIPGVVYGLAMLWLFLYIPALARTVYGTVWSLLIALIITWLPFAVRIIAPSMLQISNEMEEASSVSGSKWAGTYIKVLLPMMKVAMLASFTYVFLDTFRELGTVTLLTTPQTYVLTTFIQDLFTASSANLPTAAATSVVMMIIGGVFLALASRLLGVDLLRREGTALAPIPTEATSSSSVPLAAQIERKN